MKDFLNSGRKDRRLKDGCCRTVSRRGPATKKEVFCFVGGEGRGESKEKKIARVIKCQSSSKGLAPNREGDVEKFKKKNILFGKRKRI